MTEAGASSRVRSFSACFGDSVSDEDGFPEMATCREKPFRVTITWYGPGGTPFSLNLPEASVVVAPGAPADRSILINATRAFPRGSLVLAFRTTPSTVH